MKRQSSKLNSHADEFLLVRLMPNVFTTIGMCIGLTGIRFALESDWKPAVVCVLVAGFFDLIDGLTARVLNATSKMGAELDSLSDAVSFGVTPTIILYLWMTEILQTDSKYMLGWYWIPFIFYTSCCVLRLARFNVASRMDAPPFNPSPRHFIGVPSPAGAILLLSPIVMQINAERFGLDEAVAFNPLFVCLWVTTVGILMVSRIPTLSFKSIKYKISYGKVIFVLIGVILGAAVVVREQWLSLAFANLFYLITLPIFAFYRKRNNSDEKLPVDESETTDR